MPRGLLDRIFEEQKKRVNIPAPIETITVQAKKGRAKQRKFLTFTCRKMKAGDAYPKEWGVFYALYSDDQKYGDKLTQIKGFAKTWAEQYSSATGWRRDHATDYGDRNQGLTPYRGWFVSCSELPPGKPEWGEVAP